MLANLMLKKLPGINHKAIFSFLIALLALTLSGFPQKNDSLHFEVLMSPKMLNQVHLDPVFINAVGLTANSLILLSTANQFYLLGWGGIEPVGKKVTGSIRAYAYTSGNLLMAVRGNEICTMDTLGNLSGLFKLPGDMMGISGGKYVMYVYDRANNQKKHALYMIAKGAKYAKLFDVPNPILSVAEMGDMLLFSTDNGLFSYNLRSKQVKALASLSKDKEISSIAVDTVEHRIYFSTNNSIYALKGSGAVEITDKFGGVLQFFNKGLIVFNPEKKLLIRMIGIGERVSSTSVEKPVTGKQTRIQPANADSVSGVHEKKDIPAVTKQETPLPAARVQQTETARQPAQGTSNTVTKEMRSKARFIAEKFISNASGSLEKDKTYILKKDFSLPVDFLNNFPDGSVLKLVGSDPGSIKSWKVIKPSDGSFAIIDSRLYAYFEQSHVWLLQSASDTRH